MSKTDRLIQWLSGLLILAAPLITAHNDLSSTISGDEYRAVAASDAVSFHPYLTGDASSHDYQKLVYSYRLLKLDPNTLEYVPHMAESYEVAEDGLTFRFDLRRDMQWSDGEPITAYDFEWTYDRVVDPASEYPYPGQFEFITAYEALDDYTLQVKIGEIYAPALGLISSLITPLPRHIWENLDWSDPEKNPEINQPTVVSGPYTLTAWERGTQVIFEANQNYWVHGTPAIQRRLIEIIPDPDLAFEKLKRGEVDTAPVTFEQLPEARQLDHVIVYEWWPAAAVWHYIGLNMREGFPTHDIDIRHGLNYALDKELLTQEVWQGQAKRICSIYPDVSRVYNPDVPCYDYDPNKAIELFTQAGYIFQDGRMLDEHGKQLKLKLLYGPETSQSLKSIASGVQAYLADIGITVEIQALEWAAYLEALDAEAPEWDMFLGGWRTPLEPHFMGSIWAEENIPDLNPVAYIDQRIEALFKEAGKTYEPELRKQKYQEIQQIIAAASPYIFIAYRSEVSVQNNRIQGIEPTMLGIDWNQEDWYIVDQESTNK